MESVRFKHQLTEKTMIRNTLYQIFGKRKINGWLFFCIFPIIGLVFGALMISLQTDDFFIIFLAMFLILFGPLLYLLMPIMVKKQYKKSKELYVESEYTFDDNYIEIVNDRGNSKLYYSDFHEVRMNKTLIFLYVGVLQCMPIHKEAIGQENAEKLLKLLKEKLGNKCKY